MKKYKILFLCILLSVQLLQSKIVVFTIGDSTMANRSSGDSERGWGMLLPQFVTDEVQVSNHAINGYSTKSFIDDKKWSAVVNSLQPGNFVLIQFGHNDAKADAPLHTDPATTYKANLTKFVNESRAKGAIPVLLTSIVRRSFDTYGNVTNTHGEYPEAVRELAIELNVPMIDMELKTRLLENIAGLTGSRSIHQWSPGSEIDNTHLCNYGAYVVARLVADGIRELHIQIPLKATPTALANAEANTLELAYRMLNTQIQTAQATLQSLTTATGKVDFQKAITEVKGKTQGKQYATLSEMDADIRALRSAELAFKWTQATPFNATFAIGNPGMEEGVIWDITNNSVMAMSWTLDATFAGTKDIALKTVASEGYYRFYAWGDAGSSIDFFQDLVLSAGKYTLKADLKPNVTNTAVLYAKMKDETLQGNALGSWSSWGTTQITLTITEDHTPVRIGVNSSRAIMIDNFQLIKNEAIASSLEKPEQHSFSILNCKGGIVISGDDAPQSTLAIHTLEGQLIKTVQVTTIPLFIPLSRGIYIINNQKIAIES